jgi:hypothetical protein
MSPCSSWCEKLIARLHRMNRSCIDGATKFMQEPGWFRRNLITIFIMHALMEPTSQWASKQERVSSTLDTGWAHMYMWNFKAVPESSTLHKTMDILMHKPLWISSRVCVQWIHCFRHGAIWQFIMHCFPPLSSSTNTSMPSNEQIFYKGKIPLIVYVKFNTRLRS